MVDLDSPSSIIFGQTLWNTALSFKRPFFDQKNSLQNFGKLMVDLDSPSSILFSQTLWNIVLLSEYPLDGAKKWTL